MTIPTPEPMTPGQRLRSTPQRYDKLDGAYRYYREDVAIDAMHGHAAQATAAASARIEGLEAENKRLANEHSNALTDIQIMYNDATKRGRQAGERMADFIDRIRLESLDHSSRAAPATPLARAEANVSKAAVAYLRAVYSGVHDTDEEWIAAGDAIRAYDALLSERDGRVEEDTAVEAAVKVMQSEPHTFESEARALYRAGWRPAQEGK